MLASGVYFAYLPMHIVTSTILLTLAWLAWMHVSDGVHMPILFSIIFHCIE